MEDELRKITDEILKKKEPETKAPYVLPNYENDNLWLLIILLLAFTRDDRPKEEGIQPTIVISLGDYK